MYNCDGETCTQTSFDNVCDEGDEECWEFYNYYNIHEQGDGAGGEVNGADRNYEASRAAKWKKLLYFLIPVLLLSLLLACLSCSRVVSTFGCKHVYPVSSYPAVRSLGLASSVTGRIERKVTSIERVSGEKDKVVHPTKSDKKEAYSRSYGRFLK